MLEPAVKLAQAVTVTEPEEFKFKFQVHRFRQNEAFGLVLHRPSQCQAVRAQRLLLNPAFSSISGSILGTGVVADIDAGRRKGS